MDKKIVTKGIGGEGKMIENRQPTNKVSRLCAKAIAASISKVAATDGKSVCAQWLYQPKVPKALKK